MAPASLAVYRPLLRVLRETFVARGAMLRFTHDTLRDAVQRFYAEPDNTEPDMHRALARYFMDASKVPADSPRLLEEAPFHLSRCGDAAGLVAFLTNPAHFSRMHSSDVLKFDLAVRFTAWVYS